MRCVACCGMLLQCLDVECVHRGFATGDLPTGTRACTLQFAPLVRLAIRVVSDCLATARWRVSRVARWGR